MGDILRTFYFKIILNFIQGSLGTKETNNYKNDLLEINPKAKYQHTLECGIGENLCNPEWL